jgi:uncharacterized coiled-coil protein SlyX
VSAIIARHLAKDVGAASILLARFLLMDVLLSAENVMSSAGNAEMSDDVLKALESFRGEVLGKFERIEGKVDRIDVRLGSVESTVNELSVAVAALTVGQREIKAAVEDLADKKQRVLNSRITAIEERLAVLEGGE